MKSICFFSSYFNENKIPFYIQFYLDNLIPYFSEIIFLTNEKKLDIESEIFLKEKNIRLMYVANEGYDFGMWYKALMKYDVLEYDRIGLINDSCILFTKPKTFFNWLDKTDFDYCGMVDSNAVSYHIQSFFLIINKKAIPEVYDYFRQYGIVKDIKNVINIYEVGLSQYLINKGLKVGALHSTKKYTGEYSPMFYMPEELIKKGLPLIKNKIIFSSFRKNELNTLARMNFKIKPDFYIRLIKQYNPNTELIDFKKLDGNFDNRMNHYGKIEYNINRVYIQSLKYFYNLLKRGLNHP